MDLGERIGGEGGSAKGFGGWLACVQGVLQGPYGVAGHLFARQFHTPSTPL